MVASGCLTASDSDHLGPLIMAYLVPDINPTVQDLILDLVICRTCSHFFPVSILRA